MFKLFIALFCSVFICGRYQPKTLAIFYGYPSEVGSEKLNKYDLIVLGEGLEEEKHPDRAYLEKLNKNKIYGYVDSIKKTAKDSIIKWKETGVVGVMLDDFGFDFGMEREQQNELVNFAHKVGMRVMVNAWEPEDVFEGGNKIDFFKDDIYLIEGRFDEFDYLKKRNIKLALICLDDCDKCRKLANKEEIYAFGCAKDNYMMIE